MKQFRHWRKEAAKLNQQAREANQPEPVPNYATMRCQPLIRAVIQARLNQGWSQSIQGVSAR